MCLRSIPGKKCQAIPKFQMLHFKVASIHVTRSSSSLGRHIAVRPDFSIVWEGQVKKIGPAHSALHRCHSCFGMLMMKMMMMIWTVDTCDHICTLKLMDIFYSTWSLFIDALRLPRGSINQAQGSGFFSLGVLPHKFLETAHVIIRNNFFLFPIFFKKRFKFNKTEHL